MKSFKTKAGTELPILDLRGKDYLQVAHRLVWFREEHPDWGIVTEFVERSADHAVAKATIYNEKGYIVATAHKSEDIKGFRDFYEKAETGAIGRALAACGYGTQFAPELAEDERIVDSPTSRVNYAPKTQPPPSATHKTPIPKQGSTHPSEAQLKRLFAISKKANWSEADIKGYITQLGINSTKELNYSQYSSLCDKIEKFPKSKGVESHAQ